jgi:hypothetical protein
MPSYLRGVDGIIGWPLVSENILQIDMMKDKNTVKTVQAAPDDPAWMKVGLLTNSDLLDLEIPDKNGTKAIIFIDTGMSDGVKLAPPIWRNWKAAHTNSPFTLSGYFTPALGLVIKEESWAKEISLGPLTLTDVPIMEADSADIASGSFPDTQYEATFGLAALKRLNIIIDGKHGVAYLQFKKTPPLPYEHNRLGAVFVPHDLQSDDNVAHVMNGSPAYEAGIRNDDVLLKIGELDATKWRTDPNVLPLSRFWSSPAGTKLELTLKRGDKVFTTTAVLRNILPPDAPKNSN